MKADLAAEQVNKETGITGGNRPRDCFRLSIYLAFLGAILFISAGRLDWIMGWAFMAVYSFILLIGLMVVPLDPELIEERTQVKEGVKDWDKPITIAGSILYPLTILIVAGLDLRLGWSPEISLSIQIVALIFAASGYGISAWAMSVNKFYARCVRIQGERGHSVISEGPYQIIRHPGYGGQIIFSLSSALALGSLWTLIPSGLFALLLVIRTKLEDDVLQNELSGYKAYTRRVRYHLLPGVW